MEVSFNLRLNEEILIDTENKTIKLVETERLKDLNLSANQLTEALFNSVVDIWRLHTEYIQYPFPFYLYRRYGVDIEECARFEIKEGFDGMMQSGWKVAECPTIISERIIPLEKGDIKLKLEEIEFGGVYSLSELGKKTRLVVPIKLEYFDHQFKTYENMSYRDATPEEMAIRHPESVSVIEVTDGSFNEIKYFHDYKHMILCDNLNLANILRGSHLAKVYELIGIEFEITRK